MSYLYDDAHFRLEYRPLDGVIMATRKPSEASAAEVVESMRAALRVDTRHLGRHAIILDMRAVVGRNDDGFERATAQLREAVEERATRVVALVSTVAGALQTKRLAATEGRSILVASSEEEALRLARG